MLNPIWTVAAKEVVDAWRDRRGMLSAALYSLMGPGVVGMVSLGVHDSKEVTLPMMAVFTLVSAFVGGMNVAMDTIAGERERRSLLPLLMHPVTRQDLLLGKWLAVAFYSLAGLVINISGFAILFHRLPPAVLAVCLVPLALLAASLQLWLSTLCRGVKEAHTYLSMLVFVPMGLGMFMVFSPVAGAPWWTLVPVAGQQLQVEIAMRGGEVDLPRMLLLGFSTVLLAGLAMVAAAGRMERDDVVYGG